MDYFNCNQWISISYSYRLEKTTVDHMLQMNMNINNFLFKNIVTLQLEIKDNKLNYGY